MNIMVEARSRCLLCGCYLATLAFPSVRVNKCSLRQLPGTYLMCYPPPCPECGTGSSRNPPMAPAPGESYTASPWGICSSSRAEIRAYRLGRWGIEDAGTGPLTEGRRR